MWILILRYRRRSFEYQIDDRLIYLFHDGFWGVRLQVDIEQRGSIPSNCVDEKESFLIRR